MTIKAIKLITGEELIGEVVTETTATITLKNVVLVALQRTQTGETGLGFLPFMPFIGKSNFNFSMTHTIVVEEVDEQMEIQYNSVFGAGIVVPPKKLITG